MSFPESDKELDDLGEVAEILDDEDVVDIAEIEKEKERTKGSSQHDPLKTRRNIEDYFEKKRLRQELDYLLEEDKK